MKIRFLILAALICILLLIGAFVYHWVEGWGFVDSLYFSALSLSTRGYGGLHPTQTSSKLFTIFYLFIGMALIIYALSDLVGHFVKYKEPMIKKRVERFVSKMTEPKKERWVMLKPPKP